MNITHLIHDDRCIRCKACGAKFEIPGFVLANPVRLFDAKEAIGAKHVCVRLSRKDPVQVWRQPTGKALDGYWTGAMRRLMPA